MSTGAIVAGSGSFEPAAGWGGDHHDGVPIYILSRHPAPAWAADRPAVRYGNDVDAAVRDAKHAAGDKNVLVHGASTAQRASWSGSEFSKERVASPTFATASAAEGTGEVPRTLPARRPPPPGCGSSAARGRGLTGDQTRSPGLRAEGAP
jgi:hypothetical protein